MNAFEGHGSHTYLVRSKNQMKWSAMNMSGVFLHCFFYLKSQSLHFSPIKCTPANEMGNIKAIFEKKWGAKRGPIFHFFFTRKTRENGNLHKNRSKLRHATRSPSNMVLGKGVRPARPSKVVIKTTSTTHPPILNTKPGLLDMQATRGAYMVLRDDLPFTFQPWTLQSKRAHENDTLTHTLPTLLLQFGPSHASSISLSISAGL